jgi:hypothetical protein
VGFGDVMPADAADGAFESGEHGAAGRVVGPVVGDAEGGVDSAEALEGARGADAGGGEEAGDFGADVWEVAEGGAGVGFVGHRIYSDTERIWIRGP